MADVKFSEFPEAEVPLGGTEYVVGLQQRSTESGESNVKMTVDDIATYVLSQDSNTGGGGSVSGPVSSTDNAAALWNGTGGDTLKDSTLVVGASDATIGGNGIYRAAGTDVALADGGTGASLSDPNADRILFWDDSAGAVTWLTAGTGLTITDTTIEASGGGLTNFTEAVNSSAPNATIPVVSLTPNNAAAGVDIALVPKGSTGALLADIPDSAATGGNKRGNGAVDWQMSRFAANQVASGTQAVIGGGDRNKASGSSSTVCGGFTNDASGTQSFIGGGTSNTATNSASTVAGGSGNDATGSGATICGGTDGTASGTGSFVGGGQNNNASGLYSFITGGFGNTASGTYSGARGRGATTRGIIGAQAYASGALNSGEAQCSEFMLYASTTDATPKVMTADGTSGGTDDQVILPNNSLFAFRGHGVVRQNATGDSKAIEFKGAIKRGANAAATALLGSVSQADLGTADAGASGWTFAFTADTTNGGLAVTVTGEASHTLRWNVYVETTEIVN